MSTSEKVHFVALDAFCDFLMGHGHRVQRGHGGSAGRAIAHAYCDAVRVLQGVHEDLSTCERGEVEAPGRWLEAACKIPTSSNQPSAEGQSLEDALREIHDGVLNLAAVYMDEGRVRDEVFEFMGKLGLVMDRLEKIRAEVDARDAAARRAAGGA